MHRKLIVLSQCGQDRNRKEVAGSFFQSRTSPDRAPDTLGDDALKVGIELGLVRLGPCHVLRTQDRLPHRHALFKAIVRHATPPLEEIALKVSDRSAQCQIEKISNAGKGFDFDCTSTLESTIACG